MQGTDRSTSVTQIIKIFLGVQGLPQKALMHPLHLTETALSRKVKAGHWTVDDVDKLAMFFGVTVADFFEDPEVIRRRMLGGSSSQWMQVPGQVSLFATAA